MNICRWKLLPLAIALGAAPFMVHAENLMDAYRQAMANDPTLSGQLAQRNVEREGVPLARSQLLPNLSAGLTFQQNNGGGSSFGSGGTITTGPGASVSTPNSGHTRTRRASINLSQTILDFSKYANLSAAKAQAASANATYAAAVQDLMMRVANAYFGVLTARDTVAFQQANVDALKRQFDQAQERFKVGLSAITDVKDAKASYEGARSSLAAAETSFDDAREALTQITGQPVQNLEVLSNRLPMTPPTPNRLETWVAQARTDNPTILAQQFNENAADHSVTAARDARLPTISANVGYGKGASWAQYGQYRDQPGSTTIGLTLNVPIFAGGATHAQIQQAVFQRDGAQAALVAQRRLVVRNTRNAFRSVVSGISQVEAAKAAVTAARSALKATNAGFRVGTQTITQVLLAQSTLLNSQQQYSQARHQFVLNKLLLEQSAGQLDAKDLQAVNALLKPAPIAPDAGQPAADGSNSTAPAPAATHTQD